MLLTNLLITALKSKADAFESTITTSETMILTFLDVTGSIDLRLFELDCLYLLFFSTAANSFLPTG